MNEAGEAGTVAGRGLAAHFQARMLPLAALAGLVVAAMPPLGYGAVAWLRLAAEARVDAEQVARAVRNTVERQPYLWRYNTEKIVRATVLPGRASRTRLSDCAGRTLFPRGAEPPTGVGPDAWAPVLGGGHTVAWVHTRANLSGEWRRLLAIAAASLLTGLGVALALFLYPVYVVRRQSARLAAAELAGRVLAVQEEERRRIALDLHDGVGQSLAALELELGFALAKPDEREQRVRAAVASCDATLVELRRVVHDLRPVELDGAEVTEVLRGYTERFEVRSGVPVSFRVEGTARAPSPEIATCLLRVLQEALTNVGRHAHAHEVGVRLAFAAAQVTLEIVDDGRGFPANNATSDAGAATTGAGLRGIRERCAFLGGSANVHSDKTGTRLTIVLPLDHGSS